MKPTQFELDIVYLAQQIIVAYDPWVNPQVAKDLDDRLTEWRIYNGPNIGDPPENPEMSTRLRCTWHDNEGTTYFWAGDPDFADLEAELYYDVKVGGEYITK